MAFFGTSPFPRLLRFLPLAICAAVILQAGVSEAVDPLIIDADSQFNYAQDRFEAGDADEAVAEFNRFIHFFSDDPRVPQARFLIAKAYLSAGRTDMAIEIFTGLTEDYTDNSLASDAFFMLSRSHAQQGMIEQAMLDLHNLMALSSDSEVIDRAHYELGWLYLDQRRWEPAGDTFNRITAGNRERFQVDELQRALSASAEIQFKNPTTAGLLSILPGGGQLYCGRYRDALTAFLINGGLIWAAWESFDNELYALGSVITFVGFGFYAGNIYGAVTSAHKTNRDRNTEFREKLNRYRQFNFAVAPKGGGAALYLSTHF
jgi:tetratricopeptide (TPR) repeat protein